MAAHRLLRRAAKAVLYFAPCIVLLSIGLRVYSAWQIPKAKRLLRDLSDLRAAEPFEGRAEEIVRSYNFKPTARFCETEKCFEAYFGNHFEIDPAKRGLSERFASHGGRQLGYRPWVLWAMFEVHNGRIANLWYSVIMDDGTPYGTSVGLHAESVKRYINEASPDYDIENPSKYAKDRMVMVRYGTESRKSWVADAADIEFSCVWGVRLCRTSWDLNPKLIDLEKSREAQIDKFKAAGESCPSQNLYARLRDGGDVGVAAISKIGASSDGQGRSVFLSVTDFLRHVSNDNWVERLSLGPLERNFDSFDPRLFPKGPERGEKVIVFAGSPCIVPASPQNLSIATEVARKFDPLK